MGIKLTGKETKLGKIPIAKEPFRIDLEEPKTQSFAIEGISKMTLLELSKRDMAIEIYSEILGCNIWLCNDEEMASQIKRDDPRAITYTVDEIRRLLSLKVSPEEIKRIHDAKSVFEGSKIVDSELKTDVPF